MNLELYTTVYENRKKKRTRELLEMERDTQRENELVNLYPQVTYQTMEGFGGAITDSAGYIFPAGRCAEESADRPLLWKGGDALPARAHSD